MSRYLDLAQPKSITPKYVKKERVWKKYEHPVVPVQNERLDRLATLPEFKMVPKWAPTEKVDKIIMRPVVPDDNPILNKLAESPSFKITKKWEPPPERTDDRVTNIRTKTLKAKATPTVIALSKPTVRCLVDLKNRYGRYYGKKWSERIKNRINQIWETPYYVKKKARMDRAVERAKREKIKADKLLKAEKRKESRRFRNKFELPRLPVLATPKKVFEEPSVSRGKKRGIMYLQKRLKILAKPEKRKIYRTPSDDSFLDLKIQAFRRALSYEPSERILELAIRPPMKCWKSDSQELLNMHKIKKSVLNFIATNRLVELAVPKKDFSDPAGMRPLPWVISDGAKEAVASPRVEELAIAKVDHGRTPRPLPTPISESAKNATASARVTELAQPKPNLSPPPRPLPTPISAGAKNATASGRVAELAHAKSDRSLQPRKLPQRVSAGALHAVASQRVIELARPKINWSLVINASQMDMRYFHTHYHRCEEIIDERAQYKRTFCQKQWNPKGITSNQKKKPCHKNGNSKTRQTKVTNRKK